MFNHPAILTSLAMIAFAANSVLCRLALEENSIEAEAFTLARVGAGAIVLQVLVRLREDGLVIPTRLNHWRPALALAIYLYCFSLAYLQLEAGIGALILFAAVQLTMFGAAWRTGERLGAKAIAGTALAMGGLISLLGSGTEAVDSEGLILMAASGVAWGAFSLIGRDSQAPLATAAGSFRLAVPICLVFCTPAIIQGLHWDANGLILAALSGGVTSALGYALWYAALPHLKSTQAAAAQLTVPVLAALGGLFFLGEPATFRGLFAALATLTGVWLALQHTSPGQPALQTAITGDRR